MSTPTLLRSTIVCDISDAPELLLQNLLAHPAVAAGDVHTRFIEQHMAELAGEPEAHPKLYFDAAARGETGPVFLAVREYGSGTAPPPSPSLCRLNAYFG